MKPYNVISVLMSSCGEEAVWRCGWAGPGKRDALLITGPGGAGEGASALEPGQGLCTSRQMVEGSSRLMGCHCRW